MNFPISNLLTKSSMIQRSLQYNISSSLLRKFPTYSVRSYSQQTPVTLSMNRIIKRSIFPLSSRSSSSSSFLRNNNTIFYRFQSSSSTTSATASTSPSIITSTFKWIRTHITLSNMKLYWPQILAGSGALVVLYGISSASVHIATVLLELDMKEVFYMGFLTGVITSLGLGLISLRFYRNITIQPDTVYRHALYKLARNSVIRSELGNQIKSGSLKAYVIQPGHITMDKGVRWVEPRIQMLFQVVGDKNEGMATCEAVKHKGSIGFSVLALDTLAKPNKPSILILVAGKEEKLHVRGTLRGFLQTERAQYVSQDRNENDDDRIAEQATIEVDTTSEAVLDGEQPNEPSVNDKNKLQ